MKRFISILLVTMLSVFILANLSFAQKKAAKDMQVVVVIKDLLNPCFIEMKWGWLCCNEAVWHPVQLSGP